MPHSSRGSLKRVKKHYPCLMLTPVKEDVLPDPLLEPGF